MSDLSLSPLNIFSKEGSLLQAIHRILSLFDGSGETTVMPALGTELSPNTTLLDRGRGRSIRPYAESITSTHHDGGHESYRTPTRSSSSVSIPFDDGDVDVVRVEGLRHSHTRLEARRYKTTAFAEQLLHIIQSLRLASWSTLDISHEMLKVQKVSGSLTNAVFFVSCPSLPIVPTLLLRIYGPSSGALISRPRELHTLHALSSQYHIGPRVYGTFENGRVEEYFDSSALAAEDLHDPEISRWIGARMAELHQVDIAVVELQTPPPSPNASSATSDDIHSRPIAVVNNVKSWLTLAREVLALPAVSEEVRTSLDLDSFKTEWDRYVQWLGKAEKRDGSSPLVFAHNDAQYGNLLRLSTLKDGKADHRQIIVVDFEYASPNPAAFDIANHFHEWTANYHSDVPHILVSDRYPAQSQRYNFYRAYLSHYLPAVASDSPLEDSLRILDAQVRAWSPASHAMWALWGIVQAREVLEGKDGEPEFDYVGYAKCRIEGFRREMHALLA